LRQPLRDRLNEIDLETKHRIVLGLVKRVEIYKDEIVVVFRVDPQPLFATAAKIRAIQMGESKVCNIVGGVTASPEVALAHL